MLDNVFDENMGDRVADSDTTDYEETLAALRGMYKDMEEKLIVLLREVCPHTEVYEYEVEGEFAFYVTCRNCGKRSETAMTVWQAHRQLQE